MKSKNKEEIRDRVVNDPDFINIKRFDYSLKKLQDRYPDGAPDKIVANALCITEEEVNLLYKQAIEYLQSKMNPNHE